jgi:D-serine deaminase-like pyridoxal phosphate-dependent protein
VNPETPLPPFPVPAGVETPAAVVELARVRKNVGATAGCAREHGLQWRPHVKTHKSLEMARLQLAAGAAGLTVATPREAEIMARVCDDLLLAHPPVGSKADRILALPEHVRVSVALDDEGLLRDLAGRAADAGRTLDVLVEMDVGMGRVGVPEASRVASLARLATELGPGIRWRGILFYPGHIRVPAREQDDLLNGVAARVEAALGALRDLGLEPEVVSGGSTPTLFQSHRIPGLTEIRPGTSIFHDRDTVALGVAPLEDVAYVVLASVVSTGVPGQAVVDAGSKALAREEFRGGDGGGYGILLDRPDIVVASVSEEHGILDLSASDWRPSVGDVVRIVPNHVCVSVNLQDRLLAVDAHEPDAPPRTVELEARGRRPG